jgi:alkylation response protein AidB-like acyl-CoA dehydrogenase
MNFALSEEQQFLGETARRFLSDEFPLDVVRDLERSQTGFGRDAWMKMAELGWHELIDLDEDALLNLSVVARELGRALVPGPFLVNAVCGYVITHAGNAEQRQRLLDGLTTGSTIHTCAVSEGTGEWSLDAIALEAVATKGGYVLNGRKCYVPDFRDADFVHVFARTPDGRLADFVTPTNAEGLRPSALHVIGGDSQSNIELADIRVPSEDVIFFEGEMAADIENVGSCLESAYLVGLSERDLELSLDYAAARVQFGKPIGSFQAIQHMCADSSTDVTGMELLMYEATWATQVKDPARASLVSMAKSWCADASRRIVWRGQQIHGGFGYTEGSDIQMYFRRQRRPAFAWGTADFHRGRMAANVIGERS